jgi:hypothetical protein
MPGLDEMKKNDVPFDAYCCGMPMLATKHENFIHFRCGSGTHGRGFRLGTNPSQQSRCSCASGTAPLFQKDFGEFKLLGGCPCCGARYSVFKKGTRFEFEVHGSKAEDVRIVAADGLAAIWDDWGGPRPDRASGGLAAAKDLTELLRVVRPDISIALLVNKSQRGVSTATSSSTILQLAHRNPIWSSLILGIIASALAALVAGVLWRDRFRPLTPMRAA